MATNKSKTHQQYDSCSKCGSQMRKRKITKRENGSVEKIEILQCKICRHWISLE